MEKRKREKEYGFAIKRLHVSIPASLFYELKTTENLREIDNLIVELLSEYLRNKRGDGE